MKIFGITITVLVAIVLFGVQRANASETQPSCPEGSQLLMFAGTGFAEITPDAQLVGNFVISLRNFGSQLTVITPEGTAVQQALSWKAGEVSENHYIAALQDEITVQASAQALIISNGRSVTGIFTVWQFCATIENSTLAQRYDTDHSGYLEESELLNASSDLLDKQINSAQFQLLRECFTHKTPARECGISSTAAATSAKVNTRGASKNALIKRIKLSTSVIQSGQKVELTVEGQDLASLKLELFTLNGKKVFVQHEAGSRMQWTVTSRTLASGVYFYIVTVQGLSGQTVRSQPQKLVFKN